MSRRLSRLIMYISLFAAIVPFLFLIIQDRLFAVRTEDKHVPVVENAVSEANQTILKFNSVDWGKILITWLPIGIVAVCAFVFSIYLDNVLTKMKYAKPENTEKKLCPKCDRYIDYTDANCPVCGNRNFSEAEDVESVNMKSLT